jgi:probable F420-dependent oxidoreductase
MPLRSLREEGPGGGDPLETDPAGVVIEAPAAGRGAAVAVGLLPMVAGRSGRAPRWWFRQGEFGLGARETTPAIGLHAFSVTEGCNTGAMTDGNTGVPTGPRHGITIPFDGVTLEDHRRWYEELVRLGYTDVWSAETDGVDGFTPLALASAWTPSLRLGVAIIPVFTRGPAVLAQSVAALAEAAPGRFTFGLGTSSDVIVSRWNGIEFDEPYKRVRDTIRFLRSALAGEKVDHEYETFTVRGFRLARPVEHPPPIFLAALRPGMLRLAGREADGTILNWLSAEDVMTVKPELGGDCPIAARIFVIPSEDTDAVRAVGRRMIAAYLNVGVYAAFHRWLGRGPELEPMWSAWEAGDRKGALAAIPDELVDALIVHGSFDECRAHVGRYVANGVDIPVMAVIPFGVSLEDAVAGLAPPWAPA